MDPCPSLLNFPGIQSTVIVRIRRLLVQKEIFRCLFVRFGSFGIIDRSLHDLIRFLPSLVVSLIIMRRGISTPTIINTAKVLLSLTASKTSAFAPHPVSTRFFHPAASYSFSNRGCRIPDFSSRLFSTPTNNMEAEKKSLQDVLDFWYPSPNETTDEDSNRDYLNDVAYINSCISDWFMGGEEMDKNCRNFRELIRRTASEHSKDDDTSLSESIAKVILFDQITRNAFRREDEAFAYEDLVKEILEDIFQVQEDQAVMTEGSLSDFVKREAVYFSDVFFVAVACQHQEKSIFHGVDSRLYGHMETRWPANKEFLEKVAYSHADSHYEVLKRFGRYPHRNQLKGRKDTPEELEWLGDYDNLPVWAKSQLPEQS
jgi:uncharacterized protein (DUF924 family)